MRRLALVLLGIMALLSATVAKAQAPNSNTHTARGATGSRIAAKAVSLPLFFEANQGQAASRVKFLTRGSGYTMFLTPTETVLVDADTRSGRNKNKMAASLDLKSASASAVRMQLIGANRAPSMTGFDKLPGKVNYLLGNDPKGWHTGVPLYSRVDAKQVYPGVDLVFHGDERMLEYDFIVAPGADPSRVGFRIRGAKRIEIDRLGDLVLHTQTSEFRMHKPVIYQMIGSLRRTVEGGFVLSAKNEIRFRLAEYDNSQPVVIDPSIGYASFLGGLQEEFLTDVAVDDSNSAAPKVYVAGITSDLTSFSESHTLLGSANGSSYGFVAKLDPRSTGAASLNYLTFVGGHTSLPGFGQGVCGSVISSVRLDVSQGAAGVQPVLGGITQCSDYPTTTIIASDSITGDAATVVTRLNAAGNAVDVSAMLGGNGTQDGGFPALDGSGNVMVSGGTTSTDLPTTALAYIKNFNNGQAGTANTSDCYVALLRRSDLAPTYMTYLNVGVGSDLGSGVNVGCGGFIDSSGRILAGGNTFSGTDFNVGPGGANLANGFQTTVKGTENVFAMELDPTIAGVAALRYATYYGGGGTTEATNGAVAISQDVAAIGGFTTSNGAVGDIPLMRPLNGQNTNQSGNGGETGWVLILDTSKTGAASLVFSSYLGGSDGSDEVHAIALDVNDPLAYHLIVGGQTTSGNFPSINAFQSTLTGSQNGYVTGISVAPSPTGPTNFFFSSFIGGGAALVGQNERIGGLAVGADSTIYAVGRSASADFFGHTNPPTTVNGFQPTCASCTTTPTQPIAFDDGVLFSLKASTGATVTSIAVNPQTITVAAGNTQQFKATGFFSDGSLGDITNQVTWASDNTSAATVNAAGLATAVSAGTAHLNATLGNATTNPATMTVTGGTGADLAITITAPSNVPLGPSFQYVITVTNNGPQDAAGVVMTDPVPGNLPPTTVIASETCTRIVDIDSGATTLSCAIGALASGANTQIKFNVTPTATGGLTNTASVAGSSTDPNSNNNSASVTTSVGGATATHFSVTAPATATAGSSFNFTLTALDASNATVTGYSGTVHFTSSDVQAVLPANSTLTNGTGTFSATLRTNGGQTITATDTVTMSITGISGTITVSPPPTTHFSVSAPAAATTGTAFNITVTALTASNATATGYAGTVHFSSTDGNAALPANSTLTNGVGTFPATLNTVGSQTITATDTVTLSITGVSGAITVGTVAAPQLMVQTAGTGSGTVTGSGINCKSGSNNGCTASFTAGAQVSLTATADATSTFTSWSAVCPNLTSATCTFTMPATATAITATFTKNPPTLQSIAVTPANPTEPINSTVQFHATGTYSDDSTKDITATVTWASSNPDAATIVAGGLATTGANADLSTTISATTNDLTGSTLLTLTNSPITISVTPPPGGTIPPVPPGGKLAVGIELTATPGFSGTVTFGCTVTSAEGQPAPSITCNPDPADVTLTPNGPSQVAIVVNTFCTADTTPLGHSPNPGGFGGGFGLLLVGLTLGGVALTFKRRSPQWALSFALLTLIALGGSACSSLPKGPNGATPRGDYLLTVSATTNGTTSTTAPIPFSVE
ncbi:MAG: Ig-like domain-containing protein [Candidatus Acidiferrales bacterium]